MTKIDAVVLTVNDRPEEFPPALRSLMAQQDVELNVVVVGNGCQPDLVPEGATAIALPENVGIPQGRNIGAAEGRGEYVFFYDNDAHLPDPAVLRRLVAVLEQRPDVAYVQPRIVGDDGLTTLRRWIPRLRAKDAGRPGTVATMSEGIILIRRADFEAAGGWAGDFFLFHEGLDLAWRLWNLGRTGWYAADVLVRHPLTQPTRHALFHRLNTRNRVWAAYRNLPWPLLPVYLTAWTAITLVRNRKDRHAIAVSWRGLREGLATRRRQDRRPIRWRTVARLTAAGRPPII